MMNQLLSCLRAVAEPTRLRLLSLCAEGDMTVSDLTQILGQSQPRVSRHLKLLCEAGVLDRFREGSWVFYRLADDNAASGGVARKLVALIPEDDFQRALDRTRLVKIKQARAAEAEAYFTANAAQWDRIRSYHVDESEVEQALLDAFPDHAEDLLDIGTGTGRMLQLFADRVDRGVGIDASRDMLSVARAKLEVDGNRHCHVRHGDMYRLPMTDESYDVAVIHQVMHYADRPEALIAEVARVLRPDGALLIVDFAPHDLETLRTEHAHLRLGFSDSEIFDWFAGAGLEPGGVRNLPGDPLTVKMWSATRNSVTAGTGVDRRERTTVEMVD
jgi:ubiquinone/menaquinone biosynthesis C-methylase UbiE/DNA-binding transcriptional ArsR family regulator